MRCLACVPMPFAARRRTGVLRLACACLVVLVLGACAQRPSSERIEAYARELNARSARLSIPEGDYAAVSVVEIHGPRSYLRTRIIGRNREAIGLAVRSFYALARTVSAEMDVPCDAQGGFDAATLAWDGREVSCSLMTVAFPR